MRLDLEKSMPLLYGPVKRTILTDASHTDFKTQSVPLSDFLMYAHDNDIVRDASSSFVIEVARTCREKYGCGSGTSVLLFLSLKSKADKLLAAGYDFKDIQNAILRSSDIVLQRLKSRVQDPSDDNIRKIVKTAFPSFDQDNLDLICDAISYAGADGKVSVLRGNTADTFVNKIGGIVINSSVPKFIFSGRDVPVVFDRPDILISTVALTVDDISNILVYVNKGGIPLIILAPAFGDDFSATIEKNVNNGALVCVNCVPNVGKNERDEFLGDIAKLVGAKLVDFTYTSGKISTDVLGTADAADIFLSKIFIRKTPSESVASELKKVSSKLSGCQDPFESAVLKNRYNLLSAKISEVVVGAYTQLEQDKKYFDYVNAVYTARQAQKHGCIIGAGYDLHCSAIEAAEDSENFLVKSFCECFSSPAVSIADENISEYSNGYLLDKLSNNLVLCSDAGILDSYEAVRGAIVTASELVSTYIGSERINHGDKSNGNRPIA